jgi:prepilin-type N-terminal cleavage/methylation domain-containing protein
MGVRGLSLVEVLVAVFIVTLLTAALYAGLGSARARAQRDAICRFGGLVQLELADRARKELRSADSVLAGLGLASAAPPPGVSGSGFYNCASGPWGNVPSGGSCAVRAQGGISFAVYTWGNGQATPCLNGRPQ